MLFPVPPSNTPAREATHTQLPSRFQKGLACNQRSVQGIHTMNTDTQIKSSVMASVLALAAVIGTGCTSTGTGRCVGSTAGASMSAVGSQEKVLVNTDSHGLAIQGYDPVAYFTDKKPVKGSDQLRSTYMGAVYQFSTAEHKQQFDGAPERYAPQFGGYCAYAASINRISPIDPTYWEVVDGRLLLQHNQKAWDLWHKEASGNLAKADTNWPGLVDRNGAPARQLINLDASGVALGGYDPVAYFTDGKPMKGEASLSRMYQGATYWFTNKEHKDAFESDPAKYIPEFGGFCGYAASINKVSPINPEIWQIVGGKLVLQHTPKAFDLFNADVPKNYARAQKNWPGLSVKRCGM